VALPSPSSIVAGKYAVGLTWRPLISKGQTNLLALKKAKDEKAKNFVHDGSSPVVGLAYFSKATAPARNQTVYSLASMAAKACPAGEAVFVINVHEPTGWWIGSSVNGLPVADAFVTSPDEVHPIAQKFIEARKTPTFFGDVSQLPDSLELELDQLEAYAKPESMVRGAQTKLPGWIYPVAVLLLAFLAYKKAMPMWEAHLAALHPVTPPEVNALAEWTTATNAWLAGIKRPVGTNMVVLRTALFGLPTQVGGWDLHAASCVAAAKWRCTVTYKRPISMASSATNRTFEDARPASWKVTWKGASELQAVFEVDGTLNTQLAVKPYIVPLKQYQVDTYSEFQEISKIFGKVEVTEMAPAEIAIPKMPDGQPVPRPGPEQLAEFFRAGVSFSGPFRNLEMVELTKAPIFWREVSLSRAKSEKLSLLASEFQSVFRGDIYARDR
jgi:hypothetical protein